PVGRPLTSVVLGAGEAVSQFVSWWRRTRIPRSWRHHCPPPPDSTTQAPTRRPGPTRRRQPHPAPSPLALLPDQAGDAAALADRGRVGVRRPRRPGRRRVRLGRGVHPGRSVDGQHLAGRVPDRDTEQDGYEGPAPVGSYSPNGYGLVDMIGNVWEWTTDWYQAHGELADACCTAANPRGGERHRSVDL